MILIQSNLLRTELTSCSPSFFPFRGGCYSINTNVPGTWQNALGYCNKVVQGGTLAKISREGLRFAFSSLLDMKRPKPNNLFFGLLTKDDWVWVDNTPFNKSLWKLGYPIGGHGIQSCAVMSAGSSNKIIKSVDCRSAKYFLCQKQYGRLLKYFKSVLVYFVS